jgi:hypothetical protein
MVTVTTSKTEWMKFGQKSGSSVVLKKVRAGPVRIPPTIYTPSSGASRETRILLCCQSWHEVPQSIRSVHRAIDLVIGRPDKLYLSGWCRLLWAWPLYSINRTAATIAVKKHA